VDWTVLIASESHRNLLPITVVIRREIESGVLEVFISRKELVILLATFNSDSVLTKCRI
jgi:hypothetical protein